MSCDGLDWRHERANGCPNATECFGQDERDPLEIALGQVATTLLITQVAVIRVGLVYSFDDNRCMFIVKRKQEFDRWLAGLRDTMTRIRLAKRLDKVQCGFLGDVTPVGEGVSEMRESFGPGWRMYYVQRADVLIVMLGDGDKSTQQADIEAAIALAKTLEE